jgi:hypothetical protein
VKAGRCPTSIPFVGLASNVAVIPSPNRVAERCNPWPGYSVILDTPGGRTDSLISGSLFHLSHIRWGFSLLLQARTSGPRVGEWCNP